MKGVDMNRIRSIILLILIMAVIYLLCDMSGIVEQFNTISNHSRNSSYYGTETKIIYSYDLSIMKDQNQTGIKIYTGTIKKDALDKWEYLYDTTLVLELNDVHEDIMLKAMAKVHGGNIIIINSSSRAIRH